ncbi:Flp pilus assembly protein TadD, contains TPR repeats [Variovorax sp. PBL-H6]|uniref:tetratricopeptide repeat protein n=1 Tax=Variovorax sp. PBL-H6 TaxID=434009 RepID=UPI00131623F3|nr:tetratricopeptide repeat protein [Variovorax sp. PBL-H6]VTU29182.1 Flp pilus assembly protein TadD, contains TPR repeats [Variovorax sp. PBL-H6]
MLTRTIHLAAAAILLTLAMQAPPAQALDSASLPSSIRLANARALIEAKDWKGAIAELQGVDAPNDADWNNLMGFSHRKAKKPDYVAAERFYDTALRIEPSHRGALSYSGELYLVLDNLPKAEQRLTTLKLVCNNGCPEQDRLAQAIARYKAAGKYVPESEDPAPGNVRAAP